MAALKRFYRRGKEYFGMPLVETEDRVLGAAKPLRSSGDAPDASVAYEAVGGVLDVGDDWAVKGAVDVDDGKRGRKMLS